MRKFLGIVAAGLLFAGTAHGTTLPFCGSLVFQLATLPGIALPAVPGAIVYANQTLSYWHTPATGNDPDHLATLQFPAGVFGPVSASLPVTSNGTINSVIFTAMANLTGTFTGLSQPATGGGVMGLSGTAKICLVFAACAYSNVTVPLTPTGIPLAGFGVGGTQTVPGAVAVTMQHNAWHIGQPAMTIHTPNSTISLPTLPGGFVHGPATGTNGSSAKLPSAVLQLVTVSKTYTSLFGAFPELPLIAVLNIHIPEPGTLLLLGSGVVGLVVFGRGRRRR